MDHGELLGKDPRTMTDKELLFLLSRATAIYIAPDQVHPWECSFCSQKAAMRVDIVHSPMCPVGEAIKRTRDGG